MSTKDLAQKSLQCGLCDETFSDKRLATSHLKAFHNTTKEFFTKVIPVESDEESIYEVKTEIIKEENYYCNYRCLDKGVASNYITPYFHFILLLR